MLSFKPNEKQGIGGAKMIEHINTMNVDKIGSGEINRLIRLPKNIKQIGQADSGKRIYIEDYVVTFIRQRGKDNRYVLLGSSGMVGEIYAVFINGAIVIDPKWDEGNIMSGFGSGTWENIYKEIKDNFVQHDIVGWALATDNWEEDDNSVLKTHIANFPGEDKVLYVHDVYSREEYMYKYYLGGLKKQKGYYMYYEKNEPMQAYMLKVNNPKSNEANFKDDKTQKIRTIALKGYVEEKVAEEKDKPGKGNAVITTVLAVAMLALAFKISTGGMDGNDTILSPVVSTTASVAANGEVVKNENATAITIPPKVVPECSKAPQEQATKGVSDEKASDSPQSTKTEKTKEPVKKTKEPEKVISEIKPATYIVAKGDTLADISYKMYGTVFKVEEIMKANKITDKNVIVVGQKLVIPR